MKLENNILMYLSTDIKIGTIGKWVPIFPKEKAIETIRLIHNTLCHPGIQKTYYFIKNFIWTKNLYSISENIVKSCSTY